MPDLRLQTGWNRESEMTVTVPAVHHVLIIDDSKEFTDTACTILASNLPDTLVTGCYSGSEAIRILQEKQETPIDCIVMDLVLPCRKGGDLLGLVLKAAPAVPIVVVSGYADRELKTLLLEIGVQAVCLKPISAEELIATVTDSIARMKYLSNVVPNRGSLDSAWKKTTEMRNNLDQLIHTTWQVVSRTNQLAR